MIQTEKVENCPVGCGKGHLVDIDVEFDQYVGLVAANTKMETRKVRVTCPLGKGSFVIPITVPAKTKPLSVTSVRNF